LDSEKQGLGTVPARIGRSLMIAAAMAAVAAAYQLDRFQPSDFAQLWHAARAWVHGIDPYSVVGPGRTFDWRFPLLYPMPAVLAALPLAWLPLTVADPLVVGIGAFAFAWAVTRERLEDPRLLMCVSGAGALAIQTSQWSPLLCAAAFVPVLTPLWACKPTLGLALLAAYPSWRAVLGMAAFTLISLVAWPSWPWRWLEALPAATHLVSPIARPGGFVILAALICWRWPAARLLVAWACMPQTSELYEAVPLFLIPRTWVESGCLVALTVLTGAAHHWGGPYASYDAYMDAGGFWMLWLLYVPCTVMLVVRRTRVSGSEPGRASPASGSNTPAHPNERA
jgi:hypothetical protein